MSYRKYLSKCMTSLNVLGFTTSYVSIHFCSLKSFEPGNDSIYALWMSLFPSNDYAVSLKKEKKNAP